MSESKLVSMRLPEELWGWAGVYAAKRRSTKTAIVEAALREFREACEGGVPGLEQASGEAKGSTLGELGGPGPVSSSEGVRPPASARAPELEETSSRPEGRGGRGRGDRLAPASAHALPASSASPRVSVDAPHVAGVSEMHPVPRPARSEWERTMRSRQARLNKGRG